MSRSPATLKRRLRPAYALALATALLLSACTGDGDSAGAVSGGKPTKLGPVTVNLPEGFHVVDVTGDTSGTSHFAASTSPTGEGGYPSVRITWTHKPTDDAKGAAVSGKALLTSGYGGNSDIQRDEKVSVPGASGAWRLGFTRSYKGTPYRVGWVLADYPGKGLVLVVANAKADDYDKVQFDAVLDSVRLS